MWVCMKSPVTLYFRFEKYINSTPQRWLLCHTLNTTQKFKREKKKTRFNFLVLYVLLNRTLFIRIEKKKNTAGGISKICISSQTAMNKNSKMFKTDWWYRPFLFLFRQLLSFSCLGDC